MEIAIIGFVGVVVGALLAEYFRIRSRIEIFSSKVFDKRLAVYEQLYEKLHKASQVASDVMDNQTYSRDERNTLWSTIIFDLADFTDANKLYLNEDISVHCISSCIGVEDVYYIEDAKKKTAEINSFYQDIRSAELMIKSETGLTELDNFFRTITKSQPKSTVIDYLNKLRDRQAKKSKKKRS